MNISKLSNFSEVEMSGIRVKTKLYSTLYSLKRVRFGVVVTSLELLNKPTEQSSQLQIK